MPKHKKQGGITLRITASGLAVLKPETRRALNAVIASILSDQDQAHAEITKPPPPQALLEKDQPGATDQDLTVRLDDSTKLKAVLIDFGRKVTLLRLNEDIEIPDEGLVTLDADQVNSLMLVLRQCRERMMVTI